MNFSYIIQEGFAGFARSRMSSAITIMSVSISLFLLGVFTAITMNFSQVADKMRQRVEVEAFLKDISPAVARESVAPRMKKIRGVEGVTYISKEEALDIFKKDSDTNPFEILDSNPLPASFRIKIREGYNNSDSIKVITEKIRAIHEVDNIVYRKQLLEVIENRAYAFQIASLIIGIILAASSIILVANTIQLAVYAKREIIRTMKLVGATPTFIRLPFLIEGVVHGLVGGFLAALFLVVVIELFLKPIAEDVLLTIHVGFFEYLILICIGSLLGLLGSAVAIRRFLKEAIIIAA